jgi:hypothetical protein
MLQDKVQSVAGIALRGQDVTTPAGHRAVVVRGAVVRAFGKRHGF